MLTKYSMLLLLFTDFLLTNSMEKDKSVAENEKGKGKEKENTDQSQSPHNSQQLQQPAYHGKDKGKEIAFTDPDHQISFPHALVNQYDLPYSAEQLAAMPYQEYATLMADGRLTSEQKSMIKKIRQRGRNKLAARKYRARLLNQKEKKGEKLPKQSPFEQPMGNFPFYQQQTDIPPRFEQQFMSQHLFHMNPNFVDNQQQNVQGFSGLNRPYIGDLQTSLPNEIGNELAKGSNNENKATQHGLPFSDHLENMNFGRDSTGQIIISFQQQQKEMDGNNGIPRSLKGNNRFVGGKKAMGQLELEKGGFILNFAEPFTGIKQQDEIGGSSGIHRSASIVEGSGSGKYSYHKMFGNPIGNVESNKGLDGNDRHSADVGTTQKLSHKTNETIPLGALMLKRLGLNEKDLQEMNLYKPTVTGIEASGTLPPNSPHSMQVAKIAREYKSSSSNNATSGDYSGGSSAKSADRKRKRKGDSTSNQGGGISKSNPIEIDNVASQSQKELSPPHSLQKLPWEKKSKNNLNLGNDSSGQIFEPTKQQGKGGSRSSEIHRSAARNVEGSGSGKYSHHQSFWKGKSSGNKKSNQKLGGNEYNRQSADIGITQQLSHKTRETIELRTSEPTTGSEISTDQLQQIFLNHKRTRKEGTSKSIPNESGKVDSENQEEFSPPHSSQKKSKKQ